MGREKFKISKLNFFAYFQRDYKGNLNTKFESLYFDSLNKNQEYQIYRKNYSIVKDENLYNIFTIILFVDEADYINQQFKDDAWFFLCNKAKEFGAEKVKFFYAYTPYSPLFHHYKKIKHSNDFFYSFNIELTSPKERKEIRLRQNYFDFMKEVLDEILKNKLSFGKSELEKEFVNICTINNIKYEKNIIAEEKKELEGLYKNRLTASQKYTDEDFKQYEKLYSKNGFSWKVAFAKMQDLTSNEYIKKTSYKSFKTAYNERKNPK